MGMGHDDDRLEYLANEEIGHSLSECQHTARAKDCSGEMGMSSSPGTVRSCHNFVSPDFRQSVAMELTWGG